MRLAMIGLGGMGANLTRRLMRGSHECVVYDLNYDAVTQLEHRGRYRCRDARRPRREAPSPRVVWIMVPAAFTDSVIDELTDVLSEGDIVIDGGNGYYRDDVGRTERLGARGIRYVGIGTSGGVFGLHMAHGAELRARARFPHPRLCEASRVTLKVAAPLLGRRVGEAVGANLQKLREI